MKSIRLFLLILLVVPVFKARSQSYFLLPDNFYLQKGGALSLRITATDDMVKEANTIYDPAKTERFDLYSGKKIANLLPVVKDTASAVGYTITEGGLNLIDMTLKPGANEMSRSKFLRSIDPDDPDKIADKAKAGNQLYYKEKYTNYMKTLFTVGDPDGKLFMKPVNDDLEIILLEDPYKFNYGDDVSAIIKFKGKPLANGVINLFVKTIGGNVFPQKLNSDATGIIYFKLSREGIYALQVKHTEVSTDKTADFETWRATYTFAFSSANDLPNTYREFGFGDKH